MIRISLETEGTNRKDGKKKDLSAQDEREREEKYLKF